METKHNHQLAGPGHLTGLVWPRHLLTGLRVRRVPINSIKLADYRTDYLVEYPRQPAAAEGTDVNHPGRRTPYRSRRPVPG